MDDDTDIEWHRAQIAKNRTLIEELEAGGTVGGALAAGVGVSVFADFSALRAMTPSLQVNAALPPPSLPPAQPRLTRRRPRPHPRRPGR